MGGIPSVLHLPPPCLPDYILQALTIADPFFFLLDETGRLQGGNGGLSSPKLCCAAGCSDLREKGLGITEQAPCPPLAVDKRSP